MIKSIKKISKKHYIQCGLAMLLTGLVLYFTSALWYSKAVIVSFNAEAKKEVQYQVFYTEESRQNFNEKQSVKKPIKSGNQKVEILLPIEKIMKFRLDIGFQPGEVVISDLQVKGSKNVKLNYNEFNKNQIDKYEIRGNKLYITSNNGDPYIWYKPELNLPAGMQIDWCRFIIISVLAFLLMYKFVQYLSKFKVEKHHSRIDIVMLAVFFALLFVPMSHISDAEKSEQENRMLAKKPQLTIDGGGNNNYGVQFDAWYNDHFFGREAMMRLYNYIKFHMNKVYENRGMLFFKSNGWMLGKGYLTDIPRYSEDKFEAIYKSIENFQDYCDSLKLSCYIEIVPRKLEFIRDNTYRNIPNQEKDEAELFVDFMHNKNSKIKIIYPLPQLQQANKTDLVFFKTDHHWTEWGAYNGYLALMDAIVNDFPNVQKKSIDDYNVSYNNLVRGDWVSSFGRGASCQGLNISQENCNLNVKYKYYKSLDNDEVKFSFDENSFSYDSFYEKALNDYRVMLIGNSFTENIKHFLRDTYKELRKRRTNNNYENNYKISRWKKEIEEFKPDILIVLINSEWFTKLRDLKE